MDLNNLSDIQIKALISQSKYLEIKINIAELFTLISNSLKNRQNIISFEPEIKYFLEIYRSKIELTRFTISLIFKETYHTLPSKN